MSTPSSGHWKKGSSWVSSTHPASSFQSDDESSMRHYGGHLIAESISPENLDVIAAAKEMLAALKEAEQALSHALFRLKDDPSFVTSTALKLVTENTRAVIAKAEGRT